MSQIISEIFYIDKANIENVKDLEKVLSNKYNDIIRWAVIDIINDKLKICITYEKGVL